MLSARRAFLHPRNGHGHGNGGGAFAAVPSYQHGGHVWGILNGKQPATAGAVSGWAKEQRLKTKCFTAKSVETPLYKRFLHITRCFTVSQGVPRPTQCGGGAVRIYPHTFFDFRYLTRPRNVKKSVGLPTVHETPKRPSESAFRAVFLRQIPR